MKVVFLEEVEGTAHTGDVKNVANGFARNFLLPRRLAAPATDHYINIAHAKAGKEAKRQERLDEEAQTHLMPIVDGKSVSIEVRVGEQGKLFGSVTARDIAEALQTATGIELEHRQVALQEPIRELGERAVTVKLTRNVLATVNVSVEPIGGLVVTEEPPAEEATVVEAEGKDDTAVDDAVEAEDAEPAPDALAESDETPETAAELSETSEDQPETDEDQG